MRSLVSLGVAMMFCATAIACSRDDKSDVSVPQPLSIPAPGEVVVGVGSIEFFDVEGGVWVIVPDGGIVYDPRFLPDDFKVDGLRVRFTVLIVGGPSAQQVGVTVEVLDISLAT